MGFLDRLLGRARAGDGAEDARREPKRTEDEIAVERYRYLLRTAPPEAIEQVHMEAFGKLTTEQRALVFEELTKNAPAGDAPLDESPAALARSATRSELRQPGVLEKSFAGNGTGGLGGGGGLGFGSMFASSLLGSVAGFVIGSALAEAFIPDSVGYDQASDAGADGGDAHSGADDGTGADGDGTVQADGDPGVGDAGYQSAGFDGDPGAGFDGQGDFGSDLGSDLGSDFGSDFGDFGV